MLFRIEGMMSLRLTVCSGRRIFTFRKASMTMLSSSSSSSSSSTETTAVTTAVTTKIKSSNRQLKISNLPDETLYIIDGTSMLFNSYYSQQHAKEYKDSTFSHEFSSQIGKNIDATFPPSSSLVSCGAINVMLHQFARFIRDVKPRYLIAAFDAGKTTFRHELYDNYKAQRAPAPADLVPLFAIAPQVLEYLGCKCFAKEGYEADDVMATIGRWSREKGLNVVHVSTDKDMLQLIEPGVHVMTPWSRELLGPEQVKSKFGVLPHLLVDLQSIMGDKADNVPGIYGIGLKTASVLLQKHQSIQNLYSNLGIRDSADGDEFTVSTCTTLSTATNTTVESDNPISISYINTTTITTSTTSSLASAPSFNINAVSSSSHEATTVPEDKIEVTNTIKNKTRCKTAAKDKVSLLFADVDQKQLKRVVDVDAAVARLTVDLNGVKVSPAGTLKRLISCTKREIDVFKSLVTLKDDVELEGFSAASVASYTTSSFRYIGEQQGGYDALRSMGLDMMPIEVLRQQYHKLDRVIS